MAQVYLCKIDESFMRKIRQCYSLREIVHQIVAKPNPRATSLLSVLPNATLKSSVVDPDSDIRIRRIRIFWAAWIRIRGESILICTDPDLDLNPDPLINMVSKKTLRKKLIIFWWHLISHWQTKKKQSPGRVSDTDRRIRICTKMSRILKAGFMLSRTLAFRNLT
jgi:hypothetical protein